MLEIYGSFSVNLNRKRGGKFRIIPKNLVDFIRWAHRGKGAKFFWDYTKFTTSFPVQIYRKRTMNLYLVFEKRGGKSGLNWPINDHKIIALFVIKVESENWDFWTKNIYSFFSLFFIHEKFRTRTLSSSKHLKELWFINHDSFKLGI